MSKTAEAKAVLREHVLVEARKMVKRFDDGWREEKTLEYWRAREDVVKSMLKLGTFRVIGPKDIAGMIGVCPSRAAQIVDKIERVGDRVVPVKRASNLADALGLSSRIANIFRIYGIETVQDLSGRSWGALRSYRNIGRKSLLEIEDALLKLGISIRPERTPK